VKTASRVFLSIGIFGLVVVLGFSLAGHWHNRQGTAILTAFTLACFLLAKMLDAQADVDLDGLTLPGAHDAHEDEEIHLPGPSWYPAFYGVALMVLVLGLVFDPRVLIAGIVLTVLTTIGWAVESVHDYRREIAHAKPHGPLPPPEAIDLAHLVLAFKRDHGGADSVVQHLGRGAAEVVLVGADGTWGNLTARDVTIARTACALADTTVHDTWPSGLGARVRTTEDDWRAMGGERTFEPVSHDAPRDGTTQVASSVFGGIGIFALIAVLLFAVATRFQNKQGIAILTAFTLACFYLRLGLKHAKARPEDAAYAGEDHVTIEPAEPDPPVDLETLHLPGPSWWPAFFSVALGLLVFGLVYNTTLLLVGIGSLVVCCVGWGIESVHEYRQSISGQHHGAADALHASANPLAH
jgi:hypothetical protein